MARVATTDGSWAILHGTRIEIDGTEAVTVMIEAADPRRIAPLLMSIYGLTEREQDVTGAVLRGGSTTDLARELGVSPHTVQVHLKRIFEKTGVNSRGELVAKIYFDCYDLRTRDNRARISEMKPIRGGPKPSAERRAREG